MFDDLPEGPTVKIYGVDEIVVEKLVALSDRARNEPRDLYDLWYLLSTYDLHIAEMQPELETKLAFRQRDTENILQAVTKKEEHLRRLWRARLSHQISELPPYNDVYRHVVRALRAADFN